MTNKDISLFLPFFSQLPDPIFLLKDDKIVNCSNSFLQLVKLKQKGVINKQVEAIFTIYSEGFKTKKFLRSKKAIEGVLELKRRKRRFSFTALPFKMKDEQFLLFSLKESAQTIPVVDFNQFIKTMPDFIFLVNIVGSNRFEVEMLNNAGAEFVGLKPEIIYGRQIHDFLPRELAKGINEFFKLVIREKRSITREDLIHLNGKDIYASCTLSPVLDEKNNVVKIIGIAPDVRRLPETKFTTHILNNALLRSKIGVVSVNFLKPDLPVIMVNKTFAEAIGMKREKILNQPLGSLFPEAKNKTVAANIKKAFDNRQSAEVMIYKKIDRQSKWFEFRLTPAFNYNRQLISYLGILLDVTERKTSENLATEILYQKEALLNQISNYQHHLANVIIDTEEKQRMRIADEIHESLGAMLSAAKFNFESVKNNFDSDNLLSNNLFQEGMNKLDITIDRIRKIAKDAIPISLKFGLHKAILNLIADNTGSNNPRINYFNSDEEGTLNRAMEITIYRIIKELIKNAIKHAGCNEITIQINYSPKNINITVEDNGRGFDFETAISKGDGLKYIEQRIHLFKGNLKVDSNNTSGTLYTIELPIM